LLKRYKGNVSASEYIREAIKQNIDSMKSKEVRIILNQLKREWEINKII
jgi:Arc/MetJ-type ribon-helix-helix transcriptional regulator